LYIPLKKASKWAKYFFAETKRIRILRKDLDEFMRKEEDYFISVQV